MPHQRKFHYDFLRYRSVEKTQRAYQKLLRFGVDVLIGGGMGLEHAIDRLSKALKIAPGTIAEQLEEKREDRLARPVNNPVTYDTLADYILHNLILTIDLTDPVKMPGQLKKLDESEAQRRKLALAVISRETSSKSLEYYPRLVEQARGQGYQLVVSTPEKIEERIRSFNLDRAFPRGQT